MRILEGGLDSLVRKAQLVGLSIHADEKRGDVTFWQELGQEWGRGSGYRDRINRHNQKWFEEGHQGAADSGLSSRCKKSGLPLFRSFTNAARGATRAYPVEKATILLQGHHCSHFLQAIVPAVGQKASHVRRIPRQRTLQEGPEPYRQSGENR